MAGLFAVSTPKSVGCRCYPYRSFELVLSFILNKINNDMIKLKV